MGEKVLGYHKLPTLVLRCKAAVGNCSFVKFAVRCNYLFRSILVPFWPVPLGKISFKCPMVTRVTLMDNFKILHKFSVGFRSG